VAAPGQPLNDFPKRVIAHDYSGQVASMSGRKVPKLLLERSSALLKRETALFKADRAPADGSDAPLLTSLFWRRRWIIGLSMAGCLLAAAIQLLFATRIYSAQSRIYVQQNSPRVFSDNQNPAQESDTYLFTQSQSMQSGPVLRYALDQIDYRNLKTFAGMTGDPVEWLLQSGGFSVDVGKKDDTLLVSMNSPYREEATQLVKAVVDAYLFRLSNHRRLTGEGMVKILTDERDQVEQKRLAGIQALVQFKAENGAISFRDEKGNTTLDRLASLSSALTTAELATLDCRVQLAATRSVVNTPEEISAFVESQQMKGRDFGDKEYDDLRSQLAQFQLNYNTALEVIGANNIHAREIKVSIDLLQTKIAAKEKSIAQAQVSQLSVQLASAQEREKSIRTSLAEQRQLALSMNPKAAEYARLESDVDRLQKQADVLDSRIQEVSVNNLNVGALDVEVMDPAHADERPIKPNKKLTLAIALLAGALLGCGIVAAQEWNDKRLRTPDDVVGMLEMPMVGAVPRMQPVLSQSERGQIVQDDSMSEVAEAYRAIRTTLSFGVPEGSKTFLVTSPTSGEGKSTCSSNLAISLAQGGHRTLLIDADMRKPVQHKIFQTDGAVGLADVMTGKARLRDVLRATGIDGLFVLPCGSIPGKPAEMLQSKRFAELMKTLSCVFDRVVIDSPPVIPVTDARILAASADVTILVLRMNRSSRKLGAAAMDALRKVKANVLGAIANEVQLTDGYGYYGHQRTRFASRHQFLRMFGSAIGYEMRAIDTAPAGRTAQTATTNGRAIRPIAATQLPAELSEINDPDAPADVRWGESAAR
jgi:polysaccharide biosynthesis transport protein